MNVVLDTNAVIYLLEGLADVKPTESDVLFVSVISKIELLGWRGLSPLAADSISAFLSAVDVVPLSDPIIERTIRLRRTQGLKTADAIIAATAVELGATLWTNDKRLLGLRECAVEKIGPVGE